jgi:Fe-Mn family superoxide dismutase
MLRTAAGVVAGPTLFATARAQEKAAGFALPPLPYPVEALEAAIDAETMTIHHDKHHKAYVDNLNKALEGQAAWLAKPINEVVRNLKDLPEAVRTAVRNNGGGHWNHTFFWNIMAKSGGEPKGELAKAIDDSFGGLDAFKKAFTDAATKRFGSGWAWLVVGKEKPLAIVSTPNQDNPLMDGARGVVLGVDVWEHAYYLKYQNRRADYLNTWWNTVNWTKAGANFGKAMA